MWFTLKKHGIIKLSEKIPENWEQAQYLVSCFKKHDDHICILRPVTLNIINFRFELKIPSEKNVEMINALNNDLVADIQLSEIVVPATSYL